jgi:hypothetical protein
MLYEKWHPVTHDAGFIQADASTVSAALQDWHRVIPIEYRTHEVSDSLENAFAALPPLSPGYGRHLLVPTSAGWAGYFQNGISGSDPFPVMNTLAMKLGVQALRVCRTPDGFRYPAVIWEVYAPPELGGDSRGHRRSVACVRDGNRWVFQSSGAPLSFENLDLYELPRKRDRFPATALVEYLGAMGVRPFEDEFYTVSNTTPAIILERTPPLTVDRTFSLEQVVAGVPWARSSS